MRLRQGWEQLGPRWRRAGWMLALGAVMAVGQPAPARAEGFLSPFAGYNFGGDSGCPRVTDCEDRKLNAGVAIGVMGNVLGFEGEFGYAKDFFGTSPGLDSSVLTLMGNLMLVPKIGAVRPYALAGLGLVKTRVSLKPSSLLSTDNNDLGWTLGGGVMVLFSRHVGVRGDLRYIRSVRDLDVLGFTLVQTRLDFGRASGGVVLRF